VKCRKTLSKTDIEINKYDTDDYADIYTLLNFKIELVRFIISECGFYTSKILCDAFELYKQ
jgi:hypothetical protein